MGIVVTCPSCQKKLRVPEKAAGKKVRCPQCQGIISVPAEGAAPAGDDTAPTISATPTPSKPTGGSSGSSAGGKSSGKFDAGKQAATPTPAATGGGNWHVQTEDGETYGPVTRAELDTWFREGRITADTQLLAEGADQWQWATDIFPQLEQAAAPTQASDNPFAFAASDSVSTRAGGGGPVVSSGGASSTTQKASGQVGPKSKIVAGLLALFLGGYGVHRFYLGYTGMGLAMLFTCGGCGIWALIEAIQIFTGSFNRDAQGRLLKD